MDGSGPLSVSEVRTKRFALLDRLQHSVTSLERVMHCRRDPHGGAEWVGVVQDGGVAAYTGLQTCRSVWACPVCSAKVRHDRALRLSSCVMRWVDAGGGLLFPTLTLSHVASDPLAVTLGRLIDGWAFVRGSRAYKQLRGRLGVLHVVRAVEVTHGINGWHPHLHLLQFAASPLSEADTREVRHVLAALWESYVARAQLREVNDRAVVVRRVELDSERGLRALGEYLTKVQDGYGIAAEVVRGDLKRGRRSRSRQPFAIAESACRGSARDVALWREYEAATKGRHVLDFSPGAKVALGFGEFDEDQAAGDDPGADLVYDLTPHEWALVVRYRRRGYLLAVADWDGAAGITRALSALRRRDVLDARLAARKAAHVSPAPRNSPDYSTGMVKSS